MCFRILFWIDVIYLCSEVFAVIQIFVVLLCNCPGAAPASQEGAASQFFAALASQKEEEVHPARPVPKERLRLLRSA